MGLFHHSRQLKNRQQLLKQWWEQRWDQQTTDDAPRITKASTDKVTHLHDEGQDGQDGGNVGQSDKAHAVPTHDSSKNGTITPGEATTTEDGNDTTEATVSHADDSVIESTKVTEDGGEADVDDATKDAGTAEDAAERSQTIHDEQDGTTASDGERKFTDIPATPVTDAVAGRSAEIPHLEVSTVCADEADAARVTSTFGAQASNAPRNDAEQSDGQS